jgi:hypothetical protein
MKRLLLTASLAMLASTAAAQDNPAGQQQGKPVEQSADRDAYLTFFDSQLFDGRLYLELQKSPKQLEIAVPGHVSLTSFPPRLDRWLTVIGENGKMELRELNDDERMQPRALLGLLPIIFFMVQQAKDAAMNAAAKHYNATVLYHKDEAGYAIVDKILLDRKPASQP